MKKILVIPPLALLRSMVLGYWIGVVLVGGIRISTLVDSAVVRFVMVRLPSVSKNRLLEISLLPQIASVSSWVAIVVGWEL